MAIATTVQVDGLLNAWQRVMLEEIWTFNQCQGNGAPLNQGCQPYIQPEREPMARALVQSCARIAQQLSFWPRPKWFEQTVELGTGVPFWNQVHQTDWLKLIEFGQRAATLVQADAAVVYSDPYNQGVNDTATITVNTTVTDPAELQVFFRVADGAPGAADVRYQIEPLSVSISGGVAAISGHRALFVQPTIWAQPYELTDPNRREINAADTMKPADFVTAVDVYRVYNDTTTQVQVMDSENNVLNTTAGVSVMSELGAFKLPYQCGNWPTMCNGLPTKIKVYYRAGHPLIFGDMDALLQEAVVRYANVLMPTKFISLCDRRADRWEQDRAPAVVQFAGGFVSTRDTSAQNPLGSTAQGAVWAWDTIQAFGIKRGGKLTKKWRG